MTIDKKTKLRIEKTVAIASPIVFVATFIILGFLTPGYDPVMRTISRLSVERYGWIQRLNFLQFAIGMIFSGRLVSKTMKETFSKNFILKASSFCSGFLILNTIFLANPIDVNRFNFFLLSPSGIMHIIIVVLFVALSPYGVYKLYKIFHTEENYAKLKKLTMFFGSLAIGASILLLTFIILGYLSEFRGLIEKIIATWAILWLLLLNRHAVKTVEVEN